MLIGIDARPLKYEKRSGIASTEVEIIKKFALDHPENTYYLFSNCDVFLPVDLPTNWHVITEGRIRNGILWMMFELPNLLKKYSIEAYWGTNFLLPGKVKGIKYLVTVHDLSWIKFKDTIATGTYFSLKVLSRLSCKWADKVFAVSEATRIDIKKYYKLKDEKIVTCYNGIESDNIVPVKPKDYSMLERKNFFLFLSTLEPRKNPESILASYEKYRDANYGKEYLVFVGNTGWKIGGFMKKVSESKYREDIIFTGYVSETEKAWLLQNAIALLYVSLYEGFGLPILEAFEAGTIVITSNCSSMPEVGGMAALYVDNPLDVDEISSKMVYSKNMSQAQIGIKKKEMKKQVEKFTWSSCSEIIMNEIRGEK